MSKIKKDIKKDINKYEFNDISMMAISIVKNNEEVREEIQFAASICDYNMVEDIMYGDLGLEMDYIFEFLL